MDEKNETDRIEVTPTDTGYQDPKTERIVTPVSGDAGDHTVVIPPEGDQSVSEPGNEDLFSQYTIYSKIGSGGMGIVYLARDKRLGRFVAIKRLNHQAQSIAVLRKRFLHEARAVASLSHNHIVHIYALGEDNDGPYIVMEYIAGPDDTIVRKKTEAGGLVNPNPPLTLDRYVSRHGSLSADESIDLILKITSAVAYAHSCGVIHRDLKPSNILLDKSSEPKIVDFGLARLKQAGLDESQLTVPGEKLLSLGYGAPEQESDARHTDERSDVYGLGALLYFMLTGQNPRYFREQDIPVTLRELVVKALATDKEQRWVSAAAFMDALQKVQNKTRIEIPTVKTTWRCKWCDAVNPLTTKFCAECGWDGSESCPECGADTFVGVQYCGTCGADARAYEVVQQLIRKMKEAMSLQRYDRVVSYAGRVNGFEPAGPSGRKYLQEIATMREEAGRLIRRREQLKEQIPIEMNAENYERAARFIQQYRLLAEDRNEFEAELRQIPALTAQRDILRAQQCIHNGEWHSTVRLYNDLERIVASDDPELMKIRRAIHRHEVVRNTFWTLVCCFVMMMFYLISLPVVAHFQKPPFPTALRLAYEPAHAFYDWTGRIIPHFTEYCVTPLLPPKSGLNDFFMRGEKAASLPVTAAATNAPNVKTVSETALVLRKKKGDYERQLEGIAAQMHDFDQTWPTSYLNELEQLQQVRQESGDFEGYMQVQSEITRFDETHLLPSGTETNTASSELKLLWKKYRQLQSDQRLVHSRKVVTLGKKYVNELTELQSGLTKKGNLDEAKSVNDEILRVKNASEMLEAEKTLAAAQHAADSEPGPPQVVLLSTTTGETRLRDVEQMRAEYEKTLTAAMKEFAGQMDAWPDAYLGKLHELMDQYQRAGNYSGWESVRYEIGRFEADRELTAGNLADLAAPELPVLQQRYVDEQVSIRRKRSERVIGITEEYLQKLRDFQKKLTVAGHMDAAALVNTEIRRVRTQMVYLEAKNELQPAGPPAPPELQGTNAVLDVTVHTNGAVKVTTRP